MIYILKPNYQMLLRFNDYIISKYCKPFSSGAIQSMHRVWGAVV